MKTYKQFISEAKVVDMTKIMLSRLSHHFNKQFPEHKLTTRQVGKHITKYRWQKGNHVFDVEHDMRDPHWYNWAEGSIKSGKPNYFESGNDPLSGDDLLGAPDFRKKK